MKNESKKRLKNLYLTEHYKRFPNFPSYAKTTPPYTDKTANGLTRMINDWLNLSGWQSERISNTGRFIDNRKIVTDCVGRQRMIGSSRWIPGTGTNGTADISATVAGHSVKIEVKIGRDRQSEAQKEYQRKIEAVGGKYVIAHTFEGFLDWYDGFLYWESDLWNASLYESHIKKGGEPW